LSATIKKRVGEFLNNWPSEAEKLFSPDNVTCDRPSKTAVNKEHTIRAAVSAKIEDGNLRAAARILCSGETPAPVCDATFKELSAKHPIPPLDHMPGRLVSTTEPFQTSELEVRRLIRTFPAGSSGRPDGLRPQHIVELVDTAESGPALVAAITAFINLLLAGCCPPEIRATFFGGTLMALSKKSGGLRPIVVGYLWRRLAAKCANAFAITRIAGYLPPRQLGVGVAGGAEAAVHAVRRFMSTAEEESVLIKIDFANAFNCLFRDRMLAAVDEMVPELAAFCHLAYEESSRLKFGGFTVWSQLGPQQGDPLGPLLFCLPLQPILLKLQSPLSIGYLDDLSLGGSPEVVAADVETIERGCVELGLCLNRTKCEIVAIPG
jgi:hypothetical protein